jgi:mRNA interferase MazF
MTPIRGEVWLWDLGMVEKVRPALVMSVSYGDLDRALITVVPHTTSLRGSQFEITVPVAFLKPGAFLVQNVATYPSVRAIRRLGVLKEDQVDLVGKGLLRWLGY